MARIVLLALGLLVCACGGGSGGDSPIEQISTPARTPSPENPGVVQVEDDVILTWDAVEGADRYTVYWYWDKNPGTLPASVDVGNSSSFTHAVLLPGSKLSYSIVAHGQQGDSDFSDEVSIVPLAPPRELAAAATATDIWLSWEAVRGAEWYDVYWKNSDNVSTSDTSIRVDGDSNFLHRNLSPGDRYYYRVSAGNANASTGLSFEHPAGLVDEPWQWVRPLPQGNSLYGVTRVGNTTVAVGKSGTILVSDDGVNWNLRFSGTDKWLYDVTWAGNQFIAVGEGATVLTSADGVIWVRRPVPVDARLVNVAWNGGIVIASGTEGTLVTSSDGIDWTVIDLGDDPTLWDAASSGSRTVIVGSSGFIYSSDNGSDWTRRMTHTSAHLRGVVWSGTEFIAAGSDDTLVTSPDGMVWTTRSFNTGIAINSDICWTGTRYIVAGDRIQTSQDASAWAVLAPPVGNVNALYCDSSSQVAVGRDGRIYVSTDGENWNLQTTGPDDSIYTALWNGTQLFGTRGSGDIVSSIDGIHWNQHAYVINCCTDLIRNGQGYVGVWLGHVLTSSNGVDWTRNIVGSGLRFRALTWTGTQYVVVGDDGVIYTSPDAAGWTARSSGVSDNLYDVIWGGGQLIAVGQNGVLLTSSDGIAWSQQVSATGTELGTVAWSGTRYVAGGSETIVTSTDGFDWTPVSLPDSPGFDWVGEVIWTGYEFIAQGWSGYLLSSADGLDWLVEKPPTDNSVYVFVVAGTDIYAFGKAGTLLKAAHRAAP